jgi:hypothetical protein
MLRPIAVPEENRRESDEPLDLTLDTSGFPEALELCNRETGLMVNNGHGAMK